MTGQTLTIRQTGTAVQDYVSDSFKEILQMVDLPIEGLVVALSWAGRVIAERRRGRQRRQRPLQVIRAMSMVDDHVLRDVGLDRPSMSAIGALSAEDIQGCRMERQAS